MRIHTLPPQSVPRVTLMGASCGLGQRMLALALVLMLAISLGWLGMESLKATQRRGALERQLAELAANSAAPRPATASPKAVAFKASSITLGKTLAVDLHDDTRRHINAVVRQLNTPWQDLFNQLERITPAEVALLSIEPDAHSSTIKLQAEAKTLDTLLLYAAGLEQQGLFGRLTYSKHETNDQDTNKPIRLSFELEVRTPDRLDVFQKNPHSPTAPEAKPTLAKREKKP